MQTLGTFCWGVWLRGGDAELKNSERSRGLFGIMKPFKVP